MNSPTVRVHRALFVLACVLTMAAKCSGGSPQCDTGTQQQLANPTPGQFGVSTSIGQITIVANGNNNPLYNSYGQWQITLTDSSGNSLPGGQLRLVSDPGGLHPYASDFFYAASISQLPPGRTWNASLTLVNGSCSSVPLGSFST